MECKEEMVKHLKAAIELENQGLEKFREFAAEAKNPRARLMFERLVKDEENHVRFFGTLLMDLEKNGKLDKVTVCSRLEPLTKEDVFDSDARTNEEITDNYISALTYVIKVEEKVYLHFRELADSSEDEVFKEIFEKMADFEKEHYDSFKEELDYTAKAPSS